MQNKPQYGGGGDCGKRAHIKGPKGEVTVTIVVSWPHDCTFARLLRLTPSPNIKFRTSAPVARMVRSI
jgi:hypothetical protein